MIGLAKDRNKSLVERALRVVAPPVVVICRAYTPDGRKAFVLDVAPFVRSFTLTGNRANFEVLRAPLP